MVMLRFLRLRRLRGGADRLGAKANQEKGWSIVECRFVALYCCRESTYATPSGIGSASFRPQPRVAEAATLGCDIHAFFDCADCAAAEGSRTCLRRKMSLRKGLFGDSRACNYLAIINLCQ